MIDFTAGELAKAGNGGPIASGQQDQTMHEDANAAARKLYDETLKAVLESIKIELIPALVRI